MRDKFETEELMGRETTRISIEHIQDNGKMIKDVGWVKKSLK